jgi:hypothetical protein
VADIEITDDAVVVTGSDCSLRYRSTRVILDDGTWVAHHSRGGSLRSVWAKDLGRALAQVFHFGDGPEGGELVLSVPENNMVAIGGLYARDEPSLVGPSWPDAVEHVLALTTEQTRILTSGGEISRAELESFHAKLLEFNSPGGDAPGGLDELADDVVSEQPAIEGE